MEVLAARLSSSAVAPVEPYSERAPAGARRAGTGRARGNASPSGRPGDLAAGARRCLRPLRQRRRAPAAQARPHAADRRGRGAGACGAGGDDRANRARCTKAAGSPASLGAVSTSTAPVSASSNSFFPHAAASRSDRPSQYARGAPSRSTRRRCKLYASIETLSLPSALLPDPRTWKVTSSSLTCLAGRSTRNALLNIHTAAQGGRSADWNAARAQAHRGDTRAHRGVPVHIVAARLGDRAETILATYAHQLPQSDERAAERVAALLSSTA